jgi:hypothetical protein
MQARLAQGRWAGDGHLRLVMARLAGGAHALIGAGTASARAARVISFLAWSPREG